MAYKKNNSNSGVKKFFVFIFYHIDKEKKGNITYGETVD
jgi:hypothetical protein